MIEQGTPEWHALRCGKATASRIADIIAKTKTGYSTSRANYMAELVAERLTGKPAESYTNAAMQWGTEKEPDARTAYEWQYNSQVVQVSFIDHQNIKMSGASPDGLVDDDGLVEFKCPNTATHIDALLGGSIPGKYITQMQWQMACTDRSWCDWCSYDPRLPENMQLFVQRVQRDNKMIMELEREVCLFLAEVESKVAALTQRYMQEAA